MSGRDSPIALIAAMELEVKPLLRSFERISRQRYESRTWDRKIILFVSGVGARRAGEIAKRCLEDNPALIAGVGFAGGLSRALKCGDLFVPSHVRNLHGKTLPCSRDSGLFQAQTTGTLLTTDHIVQTREEKEKLSTVADGVDMESFSIAEVASEKSIPFVSIRVISDTREEFLPIDFGSFLETDRPVRWVLNFLMRHPAKIPTLIGLGIRSRKLSGRLSDFSASVLSSLAK